MERMTNGERTGLKKQITRYKVLKRLFIGTACIIASGTLVGYGLMAEGIRGHLNPPHVEKIHTTIPRIIPTAASFPKGPVKRIKVQVEKGMPQWVFGYSEDNMVFANSNYNEHPSRCAGEYRITFAWERIYGEGDLYLNKNMLGRFLKEGSIAISRHGERILEHKGICPIDAEISGDNMRIRITPRWARADCISADVEISYLGNNPF